MDSHKCEVCRRTFRDAEALRDHKKVHSEQHESASSTSHSSGDEQEQEQEVKESQELDENEKKTLRPAVDAGSLAVQVRESETHLRIPTRRRSKRPRKSGFVENKNFDSKTESRVESSTARSVSDTSPNEAAKTLVALSRDSWEPKTQEGQEREKGENNTDKGKSVDTKTVKKSKIRMMFRCQICLKFCPSSQALGSHKTTCSLNATEAKNAAGKGDVTERVFECPYCPRVFTSGHALGGHKKSHTKR